MKAPLAITLTAAALLGGTVYYEESRISELKAQLVGHQKNAAEFSGRTSRLENESKNLEHQLKDSKEMLGQLQERLAKNGTPGGEAAKTDAEAKPDNGKWMKGLAKLFTDPETRKTMRTQQMMGMRMMYSDLAKELGLSPQETEQMIELLTDRQMEMMNAGMKAMGDKGADQPGKQDQIAENSKAYEEQLKAMLGDDKFAKLKSYESTVGDRFMLQQFEGQFGVAGAPLEQNQKQQLLALMREERQKTPPNLNLANTANSAKQMEAMRNPDTINQFVASQEEFQKRVLERSRQFLNADQIGALEKVHQQQLELLKMQMKMSRQMLGLEK